MPTISIVSAVEHRHAPKILYQTLELAINQARSDDPATQLLLEALEFILKLHQNAADDTQLKTDLRDFLAQQDRNSKFIFSKMPIDLLFVTIAENIADKEEPIISLLVPTLDVEALYADESFTQTTLQEFTEDDTGKRKLKDLSQFILSDDRTRLIACVQTCNAAMRVEKDAVFEDQHYPKPKILSSTEQARLMQWDSELVQQCKDYLSEEEPLWVTTEFYTEHQNEPHNNLAFELELLVECLYNGGITRRKKYGEDLLPEGKITNIGIDRLYEIWFALPTEVREELENKDFKYNITSLQFQNFTEDFKLGPMLYRLFASKPDLPENESKKSAFLAPYKEFYCVEMIAKRLEHAIKEHKTALSEVTITSPVLPIVLKEDYFAYRNEAKLAIEKKLTEKAPVEMALIIRTLTVPDNISSQPWFQLVVNTQDPRNTNEPFMRIGIDNYYNNLPTHHAFPGGMLTSNTMTANEVVEEIRSLAHRQAALEQVQQLTESTRLAYSEIIDNLLGRVETNFANPSDPRAPMTGSTTSISTFFEQAGAIGGRAMFLEMLATYVTNHPPILESGHLQSALEIIEDTIEAHEPPNNRTTTASTNLVLGAWSYVQQGMNLTEDNNNQRSNRQFQRRNFGNV